MVIVEHIIHRLALLYNLNTKMSMHCEFFYTYRTVYLTKMDLREYFKR